MVKLVDIKRCCGLLKGFAGGRRRAALRIKAVRTLL
jgi:hypothetical protein